MKPVFNLLRRTGLLLGLLLAVGAVVAAGSTRDFTKTINKQFNMAADGRVDLDNKYGKIDVKTWENNAVRISVRIVVEAQSESDAREVFDRITVDFYNSASAVGATTEIASKKSSWWSWGNNKDDFSINYEVYMPATANLEVDAKYCDVYTMPLNGEAQLDIKYGNLRAEGFTEDCELMLAYGNGSISRVRDLKLELSYGNLELGEAGDITAEIAYGKLDADRARDLFIESRYSNFKLGEVREFRNEGKYDNIEIAAVDEITCETHYTSVSVGRLARRSNMDMAYGSAKFRQIENTIDEIVLNGRYTDFKLHMQPSVACSLDVAGRYTDIRLPSNLDKNYDVKDGSSYEVRGTMGRGGNAIVRARLSYGGLLVATN
jgi:predicted transcriptional regulator YdeE